MSAAGAALGFAAALLGILVLGGCRGDLVVPLGSPAGEDEASRPMVRPWFRVIGPDGEDLSRVRIELNAALYGSTDPGVVLLRNENGRYRLAEPVAVPFLLHASSADFGDRVLPDVYVGSEDTVVVDYRRRNLAIRPVFDQALRGLGAEAASGLVGLRFTGQSAHLPPPEEIRTNWVSLDLVAEGDVFFGDVPVSVQPLEEVILTWAATVSPQQQLRGTAYAKELPFTPGVELALPLGGRSVGLQLLRGGEPFAARRFEANAEARDETGARSIIGSTFLDPGPGPHTLVVPPGATEASIVGVSPGGCLETTFAIGEHPTGPVVVDLGEHVLDVQVLDARGEPLGPIGVTLVELGGSRRSVQLDTDAEGRVRFWVPTGHHRVVLEGDRYAVGAPVGGPWWVDDDLSVTWELGR